MKFTILLAFLTIQSIVSHAQPPKHPSIEERLKRTNEIMLREVQTSAEQLVVIEKNFAAFFTKADKLRKDNPPPQPPPPPDSKVKAAFDKLSQERDDNIKKVLTPTQYKRYQAIILRMEPPKDGPPPPPPNCP